MTFDSVAIDLVCLIPDQPDTRIENGVEEVSNQEGDPPECRDKQGQCQNQWVVSGERAGDEIRSEPRNPEDRFDEDRARQNVRDLRQKHRYPGYCGIAATWLAITRRSLNPFARAVRT